MATAGDVVSRALRLIKVVGIGRAASAEEMTEGLAALGSLMASWQLQGIQLGPIAETTLTTTTSIPLPPSHTDALQTNLAMRLSVEYGTPPNPLLMQMAGEGFQALQAAYVQIPILSMNDGLLGGRHRYE